MLGEAPDYFHERATQRAPSTLRLLHYPPCERPPEANEVGMLNSMVPVVQADALIDEGMVPELLPGELVHVALDAALGHNLPQ